ncbi:ESCRT-II complex, vps25 subunit [Sporormia fimetaria CBS 119925]|uniref:Vacuolar protein-sorting-associated protein 25 n=1 Tax=Sporormia fimetaria CBS 119925 TaxID=1340428 RepID=A0A6A6V7V4_9PLEO|nr:ESCRT-II complex, vps25 subunit [Sporormia fimetaria CBS 119925]
MTTHTNPSTSLDPDNTTFKFPSHYSFPPFFTLQPVHTTRTSQLHSWSRLIQSYCQHHHLWTLSLTDALPSPLFTNTHLSRSLSLRDAREIISWMTTSEAGRRAEWTSPTSSTSSTSSTSTTSGDREDQKTRCYIFWRRPEEWASVIEEWVDRTGQKGSVLTLYEIVESESTRKEEFWGMERGLLERCLRVLVKGGRAQVFGREGSEGVKFF